MKNAIFAPQPDFTGFSGRLRRKNCAVRGGTAFAPQTASGASQNRALPEAGLRKM